MYTVDMHCDTLMWAFIRNQDELSAADIYSAEGAVNLRKLKQAGAAAQFFAAFMLPSGAEKYFGCRSVEDGDYIAACAAILKNSVAAHGDIAAMAYSADDIRRNAACGKVSAVFTLEDGRAVRGELENIRRFYDMGVRAIALTWNFANCFGYPNSPDAEKMRLGLTPFGKEAVLYMQELGMLVDVSHLSDGGFYDVAALCKKPFIASHSNARAVCPHRRNLTDGMIKMLADAGGVTGLNFCPDFVTEPGRANGHEIRMIAAHARHIADCGGIDCLGIGTDFDGFDGDTEADSPLKFGLLAHELKKQRFTDDEIDKIFSGNVLRVLDSLN